MNDFVVIPGRGEGFVELSRSSKGKLFKKHILSTGPLIYPKVKGGKVDITPEFLNKVKENFDNKVCDIVQVPLAGSRNEHSEDPSRNIGEVVDLAVENDKLYAIIDARKHEEDLGKTLIGASAMLALAYTDNRTGSNAGPTLLHVAVTNRPYVQELEEYEEIIAASSDSSNEVVVLTSPEDDSSDESEEGEQEELPAEEPAESVEEDVQDTVEDSEEEPSETLIEENTMTKDELIATLKEDHSIDVADLQRQVAESEAAVALSNEIIAGVVEGGILTLSNAEPTAQEVITAISSIAEENVTLSNELGALKEARERSEAESVVDTLIGEGRVLPKQRDAYVELRLSNSEMFDSIVPSESLISLSNERGTEEEENESHEDTVAAAIEEAVNTAAFQSLQ